MSNLDMSATRTGEFSFEKAIRMMVKIRTSEMFIRDAFWDEKIFSFLHLSLGQEASAVGVAAALDTSDLMLGNHRSHGHYLAKGGDLPKMIYEVFGDRRGCCKGFGGSMHMLDRSVGFNGSTPILGSIPSLALGQAFACQQSGINNVTTVFLGDGAAEEGSFMESINLAANKKCQIIFVIEDNKYSVNSSMLDRKSEYYSHKSLFEGLGAVYFRETGQDVRKVYETTVQAVRAAKTGRPVVMHLVDIIRRHAHSGPILEHKTESYRVKDTIEDREANDCIEAARKAAIHEGYSPTDTQRWIDDEQTKTLAAVTQIKNTIEVRSFD
jgi:TPP-dependent pyruvate/acetoin dehydrogenase alpha subunit